MPMKRIDPDKIRNILVVRNDRFGEFLLNIPALRALRETFINSRITIVLNPYVRELAGRITFIDEIIEWERGKHSIRDKLNFVNLLKKRKINMAVILNPSKEFNIFCYMSGIPIRIGYDRKWGFLLTHKMMDKKYLGEKHESEYNLDLVALSGARTKNKALALKVDQSADSLPREYAEAAEGAVVTVHPFTSDPIKQWPLVNFSDLIMRLASELNVRVIVVGGKEELITNHEFSSGLAKNVINLIGKTSILQLAAILSKSKLLVSGDSGPVHLASCVNTAVIAIFRNDIPAKSSVRWGPRSEGSVVLEKGNLKDISVEEVFRKVREVLKI